MEFIRKRGIFLILTGLAMIGGNMFLYVIAHEALSWPTASGKILKSAVRLDRGGDEDTYVPDISYDYHAYGVHHIADTRRLGGITGFPESSAKRIVEQYPEGRAVTVYFNPHRPTQAVLEPGETDWMLAAFGVIWVVSGLALRKTSGSRERALPLTSHSE